MARDFELAAVNEPEGRTQYLLEAADTWYLVGNKKRAHELYEQLLGEKGPDVNHVRVEYASMLVGTGEHERARALLDEVWDDSDADSLDYLLTGQIYKKKLNDPETALRWFDRGIAQRVDPASMPTADELSQDRVLLDLFRSRRRARAVLEKPADEWDELAQESQEAMSWEVDGETDDLADFDDMLFGAPSQSRRAWLYWPREEFGKYRRRWLNQDPDAPETGEAHLQHRRQIEGELRADDSGLSKAVVYGDVNHYAEFAAEYNLDPTAPETQTEYATVQAEEDNAFPWPPEHGEKCWCGSGRQYQDCCGHLDFPAGGYTPPAISRAGQS